MSCGSDQNLCAEISWCTTLEYLWCSWLFSLHTHTHAHTHAHTHTNTLVHYTRVSVVFMAFLCEISSYLLPKLIDFHVIFFWSAETSWCTTLEYLWCSWVFSSCPTSSSSAWCVCRALFCTVCCLSARCVCCVSQCKAVSRSVLQRVAACCSVLQRVAACCSVL